MPFCTLPDEDRKYLSADDAMKAGRCPECGIDLKSVNAIGHLNNHWTTMPKDDRRGVEGLRRRGMLLKYITDNKVRTSNQPKPAGEDKPKPEAQPEVKA